MTKLDASDAPWVPDLKAMKLWPMSRLSVLLRQKNAPRDLRFGARLVDFS